MSLLRLVSLSPPPSRLLHLRLVKAKQAPRITPPMSIGILELFRNNPIYFGVLNHAIPSHGAHPTRARCAVLYIADELR
jgi:hypothetical protein